MNIKFSAYSRMLIPLILGVLALNIPLLRDFHLESALLVSVIGCFWAGWKAAGASVRRREDVRNALQVLGYLSLFGIPLLVYSLAVGCFSVHGLGFWLLYPIPSVFFGYAVGRLCRMWDIPHARTVAAVVLAGIAAGVFLVEFFSFPQVYFFNHVWGGWPGPIYDETVQLSGSLVFFRMLTLCWILLLWFIPSYKADRQARLIFWLSVVALVAGYAQMAEMGVISPESHLQKRLGGLKETKHFRIFYDNDHYTAEEVNMLALEHEFYLKEIARALDLAEPDTVDKIQSYLYAHPWQKKQLVGAKFTSYVPVWLEQDQLHIARQQIESSLRHEMVHVLSKRFGTPVINASWSIGLVEGIAVALAPDESPGSTIDQIVASEKPYPGTSEMRNALQPLGFYGGRSAVNYTTSGSFVQYLLREYPAENFKQAYRTGDVESAYGVEFSRLVNGWHRHLNATKIDSADVRFARRLFSIPSLFEQACPRVLTDFARHWDRYRWMMAEGDTTLALQNLDLALSFAPANPSVKAEWTFQNLKAGNIEKVQFRASVEDTLAELQMLYADAFALSGEYRIAHEHLNKAAVLLSHSEQDSTLEVALASRVNPEQWAWYLQLTYKDRRFDPETYSLLYYRTKIRGIQQAIRQSDHAFLEAYAKQLLSLPVDEKYIGTYLAMIHHLGFNGNQELAEKWVDKLTEVPLRERHKERLEEQNRWIRYIDGL